MRDQLTTSLDAEYRRRFAGSARRFEVARQILPSGITHDARHLVPFPIYVERAKGTRKWDVDGNELIDYWMGHGALLLGHAHPLLVEAVQRQVERGTHYGACHDLEVRWAQLVQRLMPAAEMVRFTNSGTEATHLAMRLARAFTGREKVVKFEGHFHGWHDYATPGARAPYDLKELPGVPEATREAMLVAPPNDPAALEALLKAHSDVAAVIVEGGGGAWGEMPVRPSFVVAVAELARRYGVLLILDEVVTGFRMAPGGAQEYYGVRPDLFCLAKILCGGLPGGAVAGRRDVMERLVFADDDPQGFDAAHKVAHQGTFNANPLSAAAGIAMLEEVAKGQITGQAIRRAKELVARLNEVLERRRAKGFVYGEASWFHIALGAEGDRDAEGRWWPKGDARAWSAGPQAALLQPLRRAMLVFGVDLMRNGGFVSAVHSVDDVEATVQAFDRSVVALVAEGQVPSR